MSSNNLQPSIITGLFTIFGVIIGSLLQSITSWISSRNKKIANVRKSLFLSLTLWEIMYQNRFEEFAHRYVSLVESKNPGGINEEFKRNLVIIIRNLLSDFFDEQSINRIDDIANMLNNSIDNLSNLSPVLAFKLQSCQNFVKVSFEFRDWFTDLKDELTNNSNSQAAFNIDRIFSDSNIQFVENTIDELEKFCLGLAIRYDIFSYLSLKWTIWKCKKRFEEKLNVELEKYVDKYFTASKD